MEEKNLFELVRDYLDATEGNVHYTDQQHFLRREMRRAVVKEDQYAQQSRDEQVQGGEASQRQSDGAEGLQSEAGSGDNAVGAQERSGNG